MPNLLDPQGQPETPQGTDVPRALEPVLDPAGSHVRDEGREFTGDEAQRALEDFFRSFDARVANQRICDGRHPCGDSAGATKGQR